MGYIQNQEHFINYINKVLCLSEINRDDILDAESYIEFIYNKGLHDVYCWQLKTQPKLLESINLFPWISTQTGIGVFSIPSCLEHVITAEFSSLLKELSGSPGVYSFWTKTNLPLYVGVSINLSSRAIESFHQRFNKFKKPIYFKYIITNSASDAALLEVYYICKLKPALNGTGKHNDDLTLKITKAPIFSPMVLCNRIKGE